jgi:hypothetical protein
MIRSYKCSNCRAYEFQPDINRYDCTLTFKQKGGRSLGDCPRPKTVAKFVKCLATKRGIDAVSIDAKTIMHFD